MATPVSSTLQSPSIPPTTPSLKPNGRVPTHTIPNSPDTLSPPPAQTQKSCWTKFLECLSKIPCIGKCIARCLGLPVTSTPLPANAPVTLTLEQREINAKRLIISAFASETPSAEAVRSRITLFNTLRLATKLDVVHELQMNGNCPHSVLIQFIKALEVTGSNNPLNNLYHYVEQNREVGETRTGAVLVAENAKTNRVIQAVSAYIEALRIEHDTQKKTLIVNAFNSAQAPAPAALQNVIPVFASIETPKCKWNTLLELTNTRHVSPAVLSAFTKSLPSELLNLFYNRVEANAKVERARIRNENNLLDGIRAQAQASGTPAPARQNAPLPAEADGATYFAQFPLSDVVRQSLLDLRESS